MRKLILFACVISLAACARENAAPNTETHTADKIRPIITHIPIQISLKPIVTIIGHNIGMVKKTMDKTSTRQPKITKIIVNTMINNIGEGSISTIN